MSSVGSILCPCRQNMSPNAVLLRFLCFSALQNRGQIQHFIELLEAILSAAFKVDHIALPTGFEILVKNRHSYPRNGVNQARVHRVIQLDIEQQGFGTVGGNTQTKEAPLVNN